MTVIVIEIKKINVIVIDIILCNWTQPGGGVLIRKYCGVGLQGVTF